MLHTEEHIKFNMSSFIFNIFFFELQHFHIKMLKKGL